MKNRETAEKCSLDRAVSVPLFGLRGPGSNSAGGGLQLMKVRFHCTGPSIITSLSSIYDLNNVE